MSMFILSDWFKTAVLTRQLPKDFLVVEKKRHALHFLGFKPINQVYVHFDTIRFKVEDGILTVSVRNGDKTIGVASYEGVKVTDASVCVDFTKIDCKFPITFE